MTLLPSLRTGRFGRCALCKIEVHAVPHRVRGRPRAQDRGEVARLLNRPVVSAKRKNRADLIGTDARQLEELSRIREIHPDRMRHGRLLAEPNVLSSRAPEGTLRPRICAQNDAASSRRDDASNLTCDRGRRGASPPPSRYGSIAAPAGLGRYRFTANTQITPPCGTSVFAPRISSSEFCIRCASTPQPDCTAMYCTPSTAKELGPAVNTSFVRPCTGGWQVFD